MERSNSIMVGMTSRGAACGLSEVKETTYDFSFLKDNPYANITEEIYQTYKSYQEKKHTEEPKTSEEPTQPSLLSRVYKAAYDKAFDLMSPKDNKQGRVRELLETRKAATTYKEWLAASEELDRLEDKEQWKRQPESDLYDYKMVQNQLDELRSARLAKDYHKLVYIMRTAWTRHFAGTDNTQLYDHCYVGTKFLIEEYLAECEQCLQELTSPECPLEDHYILEMLMQTRRNYGRMAITMSGGGTFGLTGIGVFAGLFEEGIFPKIVSGSSCGSIMSAIVCSKHSNEVKDILNKLYSFRFEVFSSDAEPENILSELARFLKYGVCFENDRLEDTIKELVGEITFKEAYNKTGRILNITVSPATIHDQPTLLNYLTAPNVLIWSAICASCALPLVFPSSAISERDPKTGIVKQWSNPMVKFVDGSVNGDLPITRLSEMFNVNHVVACQANPHVLPLVKFAMECDKEPEDAKPVTLMAKKLLKRSFKLASFELIHYFDVCNEMGIFPNICTKLKHLILQPYRGDITILPDIKFDRLSVLFANPTPEFLWDCIIWGERATWPRLRMIKDHCAIEFALDKHISLMKSRMIANASPEIQRPVTLLNTDEVADGPLADGSSGAVHREKHFRLRSESLSCYYFNENTASSGPGNTTASSSPSTTPKKSRVIRKRYSSSNISLRRMAGSYDNISRNMRSSPSKPKSDDTRTDTRRMSVGGFEFAPEDY